MRHAAKLDTWQPMQKTRQASKLFVAVDVVVVAVLVLVVARVATRSKKTQAE